MVMVENMKNTALSAQDARQIAPVHPELATDGAGHKLGRFNDRTHALQLKAARQIAREPVKAAALSAAAGALLAAVVLRRWRGGKA